MVNIFIAYSRKDIKLKNKLIEHLNALVRLNLANIWHDRNIDPGNKWEDEIDKNMEQSEIILLLISSSFIDSYYCFEVELKKAFELAKEKNTKIIPVILRTCAWTELVLNKYQVLPTDGKPVQKWTHKDDALHDIYKGV